MLFSKVVNDCVLLHFNVLLKALQQYVPTRVRDVTAGVFHQLWGGAQLLLHIDCALLGLRGSKAKSNIHIWEKKLSRVSRSVHSHKMHKQYLHRWSIINVSSQLQCTHRHTVCQSAVCMKKMCSLCSPLLIRFCLSHSIFPPLS